MQTITATKQFTSNVQELYDAWIEEAKLKQWWRPAGNKLVEVTNEVAVGGNIRYAFETKEGNTSMVISGQYKEVKPAAKLVYTWDWTMHGEASHESHFELTVAFSGNDAGSAISIRQLDLDATESIHPLRQGWDEALESLAAFLS